MSAPTEPSTGDPATPPAAGPQPTRHRPWGWIIVCGLLVIIAVGLGIWALGLSSDLDDQEDQTAQAQQQADQANEQLDEVSQSVDDAADNLAQAGDDAEQALAELRSKLAAIKDQIGQGGGGSGGEQPADTPEPEEPAD